MFRLAKRAILIHTEVVVGAEPEVRRQFLFLIGAQMLLQVLLHLVPFLGRFVDIAGMGKNFNPDNRFMGILCNGFDNFSYAAWAQQAAQGHFLMTDLYATEPHAAVLFNPYFCLVGALTWLLHCPPILVLAALGFVAIPVMAWGVAATCRCVGMSDRESLLAVALVLFATGPSLLLRGLGGLWGGNAKSVGIDLFFYDLFPSTSLLATPYQAAATAMAAVVLLLIVRTLGAGDDEGRLRRVFLCAFAIAILVLVRPYQAAVLGAMFPLMLVARSILQGRAFRLWATETAIALCLIAPPVFYLAWVAGLPVWKRIEQGFLMIEVTRLQIESGFALFWIGAAIGVVRAVRERRVEMLIFGLWFVGTVLAVVAFGRGMTKFADSAVIGYAILTAYGLAPLVAWSGANARPSAFLAVRTAVFLAICTTGVAYGDIVHSITPEPDVEILSIAKILRSDSGTAPPLVLTSCDQSTVLPAFAYVRTYAGHWALTPDYVLKCRRVERAGFGGDAVGAATKTDFQGLLADLRPQYIVTRAGTPADRWAGGPALWSGQRWNLYKLMNEKPANIRIQ